MRYTTVIMFILVLSVGVVFGDNGIHKNSGTTYFTILKINPDARSAALGDAAVALSSGVNGIYSNPATLGFEEKRMASITYNPIIADVYAGALGVMLPFEDYGVFAGNFVYLSSGALTVLNSDKKIEGTLHPFAITGSITWAKVFFENISFGVTLKGIYEQLSEGIEGNSDYVNVSADGFAFDFGGQYINPRIRFKLGVLIKNLGFVRGLPFSVATGFIYGFRYLPTVSFAFDIEKPIDEYLNYKSGLEIDVYRKMFFLRVGTKFAHEDLRQVFKMFENGSFDDSYKKANSTFLTVGLGINTTVKGKDIIGDFTVKLNKERVRPWMLFTIGLGF